MTPNTKNMKLRRLPISLPAANTCLAVSAFLAFAGVLCGVTGYCLGLPVLVMAGGWLGAPLLVGGGVFALFWIPFIISDVAKQFHWWCHCPTTVGDVAEHFVHLPPKAYPYLCEHLSPRTDLAKCSSATIDIMRRISYIYGVARNCLNPRGDRAQPGWNRALLKNCNAADPEDAVREIYYEVLELLRKKCSNR